MLPRADDRAVCQECSRAPASAAIFAALIFWLSDSSSFSAFHTCVLPAIEPASVRTQAGIVSEVSRATLPTKAYTCVS